MRNPLSFGIRGVATGFGIILLSLVVSPLVHAFTGGGAGINGDPYVITTCAQLQEMNDDLSAHYTLTTDIDCSESSTWNSGAGFVPIGSESTPFTGRLLGQGHKISNLYINLPSQDNVGFFGVLNGDIQQVSFRNADITASSQNYSGVVAGKTQGSASIYLVSATGTLDGFWFAGGLVGGNSGTIDSSYANVTVSSVASRVGGLVGDNAGTISTSYSRGAVTIADPANDHGGLVGYDNSGEVTNSFWDTDASAHTVSGGGTGKTSTEMKDVATYTSMATSGLSAAWDFTGTLNDDAATSDWWSIDATRNSGYPFLTGEVYDVDPTPPPVTFDGGDGSIGDPYQIVNCEQLQAISQDLTANYMLTANIDCSVTNPDAGSFDGGGTWADGKGFNPLGEDNEGEQFSGNLNGQGHSVDALYINRSDENTTGVFGAVALGSTISNLSLTNLDVAGAQATGGLAGVVYGTVSNCYSSGSVAGEGEVGGLVGGHNGWDTVEDSSSDANVMGNYNVGGLVGTNNGNIYRSHATGMVGGNAAIGGLVGATNSDTTIEDSFATGDVGGYEQIGGLVGTTSGATINNTYATGSVEGMTSLGGLVGSTGWSMVENSYATGNVTSDISGDAFVGGLGGDMAFTYVINNHSSSVVSGADANYLGGLVGTGVIDVEHSYATGTVNGSTYVGGLVGALACEGANVTASFSTGTVTAYDYAGGLAGTINANCNVSDVYTRSDVASTNWAGGLASDVQNATIDNTYVANSVASDGDAAQAFIFSYDSETVSITDSFFDNETAGQTDGSPAVGKSTTDMKTLATFTTDLGENAWDFDSIWKLDPDVNSGYPCLLTEAAGCVEGSAFTTGDGSTDHPYLITSCEQLQAMHEDLAAHYLVTYDIDCSHTVTWNGGRGFEPIGDDITPFTGTLDGQDYTVNGLYIQRADDDPSVTEADEYYVGLFGYLDGAEVHNINLVDSKVKGYRYVGGIAGYSRNSSIHDSSFNVGQADNSCAPGNCVWARWGEFGGGIVGYSDNNHLYNLSTGGPVKGSGVTIGGIVGEAHLNTVIEDVSSTSNIDGGYAIGGLVGGLYDSTLADGTASGTITSVYDDGFKLGSHAGGAVGYAESSTLSSITSNGAVTGWGYLGGLAGATQDTIITDSNATGPVDGIYDIGGLVGSIYGGSVSESHAEGEVDDGNNSAGGFAGEVFNATIDTSYATGDVNSNNSSYGTGGFVGVSYCDSSFDTSYATGDIFGGESIGGFVGVDGCEGPGSTFTESHATGDVISTDDYVGGFIGHALATNLDRTYATGYVNSLGSYVGGLAGYFWTYRPGGDIYGQLTESYATGDVYSGMDDAGGLVGAAEDAAIHNSYARGNVESGMRAGGFIGKAYGTQDEVHNSYATGSVMAGMAMGGFIAEFDAYPESHEIQNSFWDSEASNEGSTSQSQGTGKSTAEMKNAATFKDAGWNFTDTWGLTSEVNDGYPCLQWSDVACVAPAGDNDGISEEVENAGPNGGDANDDGILDSQQDTVASFVNSITGKYVTVEVSGGCTVTSAGDVAESSLSAQDAAYAYAGGLIAFTAHCDTPGDTAGVKLYFYDTSSADVTVRKYNASTHAYFSMMSGYGMNFTTQTIDGHSVATADYELRDGGTGDSDGVENGDIVDPIGLASEVVGAPNTGLGESRKR